jgi:DNA-binding CsgD family transcriptional regulator
MDTPTHADYRRALELVGDLYAATNGRACRERFLHGMFDLVGCDVGSINVVPVVGGAMTSTDEPVGTCTAALKASIARLLPTHPAVADAMRARDGAARRLSDFISERCLRDTALYAEFYGKLRLLHELSVVYDGAGEVVLLGSKRECCDFGDRELLLLDLLAPHLRVALRRAGKRKAAVAAVSEFLTAREIEILDLVAVGSTNVLIAQSLGISPRTVQSHLANAYAKIGTRSRAGAFAHRLRVRG